MGPGVLGDYDAAAARRSSKVLRRSAEPLIRKAVGDMDLAAKWYDLATSGLRGDQLLNVPSWAHRLYVRKLIFAERWVEAMDVLTRLGGEFGGHQWYVPFHTVVAQQLGAAGAPFGGAARAPGSQQTWLGGDRGVGKQAAAASALHGTEASDAAGCEPAVDPLEDADSRPLDADDEWDVDE